MKRAIDGNIQDVVKESKPQIRKSSSMNMKPYVTVFQNVSKVSSSDESSGEVKKPISFQQYKFGVISDNRPDQILEKMGNTTKKDKY